MAYTKTVWVNGETRINDDNLNKIEQGIYDAHSGRGLNSIELTLEDATVTTPPMGNPTYTQTVVFPENPTGNYTLEVSFDVPNGVYHYPIAAWSNIGCFIILTEPDDVLRFEILSYTAPIQGGISITKTDGVVTVRCDTVAPPSSYQVLEAIRTQLGYGYVISDPDGMWVSNARDADWNEYILGNGEYGFQPDGPGAEILMDEQNFAIGMTIVQWNLSFAGEWKIPPMESYGIVTNGIDGSYTIDVDGESFYWQNGNVGLDITNLCEVGMDSRFKDSDYYFRYEFTKIGDLALAKQKVDVRRVDRYPTERNISAADEDDDYLLLETPETSLAGRTLTITLVPPIDHSYTMVQPNGTISPFVPMDHAPTKFNVKLTY